MSDNIRNEVWQTPIKLQYLETKPKKLPMKIILRSSKDTLVGIVMILMVMNFQSLAQTLMPLPAQSATYTGNTRGYWFEAPTDFRMVGIRVPTDASTDDQSVAVVRFNNGAPPYYATTTNDFTLLALFQDVSGSSVLTVNIPVYEGDFIGVLGSRGAASTNSYGANNYATNILGESVTLARLGMQYDLESQTPINLWQENATNLARVEIYYKTLIIDDYPYCDDFEEGDGSWTISGFNPSWEFGQPNNSIISGANSGDSAWITSLTGDYNNGEISNLVSPEFDLSALVDPHIRFSSARAFQNGIDGLQLQVSVDSGYTYSVLGSSSSSNWYNSGAVSALIAQGNGNGFTGTASAWNDYKHSMASYANDTSVFFRLFMASNGSTVTEGFGFDDLIVAESEDIQLVDLIYPDTLCGASATEIKAYICNNSITYLTDFDIELDTNGTTFTYTYSDTLPVCSCDTVDVLSINTIAGGSWDLFANLDGDGDVNSANDTMSGQIIAFPSPSVSITGGGNKCEGELDTITFMFGGTSPWNIVYTNGFNNLSTNNITSNPYSIIVTASGNYSPVNVSDSSGCAADSANMTGLASIVFNPTPTVDLGPDTVACGEFEMDAGLGVASYQWSNGLGTMQTAIAKISDVYDVTVSDSNGCEGYDEIDVEILPLPKISIDDTVICEGSFYVFNAGGGNASYMWHDGSTSFIYLMDSVGVVSVTVTGFNGCVSEKAAAITAIVPLPTPNISSTAGLAPVTLDAGSGYAAYIWSTNDTTQTIVVSTPGTYDCTVTNSSGCQGEDSQSARIWPNSIEEAAQMDGFAVYPNPASTYLTLQFASTSDVPAYCELYDMQGRVIQRNPLNKSILNQSISLPANMVDGEYFVRFVIDNVIVDKPIIVRH
jgi:hypothetical protein